MSLSNHPLSDEDLEKFLSDVGVRSASEQTSQSTEQALAQLLARLPNHEDKNSSSAQPPTSPQKSSYFSVWLGLAVFVGFTIGLFCGYLMVRRDLAYEIQGLKSQIERYFPSVNPPVESTEIIQPIKAPTQAELLAPKEPA